ncbi:MAG: dephospho-CoA kinase [Roseinatronobacter sp.]
MTVKLGLTGSIAMGKSTTAQFFRDLGVPVWDADAVVHALYQPGQAGAQVVARLCPDAVGAGGQVDRAVLRAAVTRDAGLLDQLNAAIHPLVAQDRAAFLAATDAPLVVLDIPLLFETGARAGCDAVLVVTAPEDVQRARAQARGMSDAELALIRARQMPDAEKRARADHVIETTDMDTARRAVQDLVVRLQGDA